MGDCAITTTKFCSFFSTPFIAIFCWSSVKLRSPDDWQFWYHLLLQHGSGYSEWLETWTTIGVCARKRRLWTSAGQIGRMIHICDKAVMNLKRVCPPEMCILWCPTSFPSALCDNEHCVHTPSVFWLDLTTWPSQEKQQVRWRKKTEPKQLLIHETLKSGVSREKSCSGDRLLFSCYCWQWGWFVCSPHTH